MHHGFLGEDPTPVVSDEDQKAFAEAMGIDSSEVRGLPAKLQGQINNLENSAKAELSKQQTPQAWAAKRAEALNGLQTLASTGKISYAAVTAAISIGVSAVATPVVGAAVGAILTAAPAVWEAIKHLLHDVFENSGEVPAPSGPVCVGWYGDKDVNGVHFHGGDFIARPQKPSGPTSGYWQKFPFDPSSYDVWMPAGTRNDPSGYWGNFASNLSRTLPGANVATINFDTQQGWDLGHQWMINPPRPSYVWPYAREAFLKPQTVLPIGGGGELPPPGFPLFPYREFYAQGIGITGADIAANYVHGGDIGVLYRNVPFLWKAISDVYVYGSGKVGHYPGPFLEFLVQALIQNAENWYNCQPHTDARTILKAANWTWNHLHEGPTFTMRPRPSDLQDVVDDLDPRISVIELILGGYGDPTGQMQQEAEMTINVGPLKTQAPVVRPRAPLVTDAGTSSSSTASTVLTTTLIAAALGTGALLLYAHAHHTTMGHVLSGALKKVGLKKNPLVPARGGTSSAMKQVRRELAYRVNLDAGNESIGFNRDGTAVLFRNGRAVVLFKPTYYQLAKIRSEYGSIGIFTDQILRTLIG